MALVGGILILILVFALISQSPVRSFVKRAFVGTPMIEKKVRAHAGEAFECGQVLGKGDSKYSGQSSCHY